MDIQEINQYFAKNKKKFYQLSLIGFFFILFVAGLSYKIHSNTIHDYQNVSQVLEHYNKIQKTLGETLVEYQKLKVFDNDSDLIIEESKDTILTNYDDNRKHTSSEINAIEKIIQKNEVFKQHREILSETDLFASVQKVYKEINSVVISREKKEWMLTNENLKKLLLNIELNFGIIKNDLDKLDIKLIDRLGDIGLYIVLLSILSVLVIWLLIFMPMLNNLTEQQDTIAHSILDAQSANRSKTEFMANISHEIRTPMTAITGYLERLTDKKVDDSEKGEYLKIIQDNSDHLLSLIDDILDISKIESKHFILNKEYVNLKDLLNNLYNLLRVKAEDKNIEFNIHYLTEVPSKIITDEKRLKQILFNVIGNALKFTDVGEVKINVSYEANKSELLFEVIDTGIGISKKQIKKLFNPFSQADNSITRKFGGTGLGLALSLKIAQKMNGDIFIKSSRINEGSVFVIKFNNVQPHGGETSGESFEPSFESNFELVELNENYLKDYKVLVVDDAKENCVLFKMYLEDYGAQAVCAYNGEEAVQTVKADSSFDIILLDLQMPIKDGFQAIHELRMMEFSKPIVALTAHAFDEEKDNTRSHGFDGHISKPVDKELLARKVKLLSRKS